MMVGIRKVLTKPRGKLDFFLYQRSSRSLGKSFGVAGSMPKLGSGFGFGVEGAGSWLT